MNTGLDIRVTRRWRFATRAYGGVRIVMIGPLRIFMLPTGGARS